MTGYDPTHLHWWTPEGTGEITRNWFRPVCDPMVERRKIPVHERNLTVPPPGKVVCPRCACITSHPSAAGRAS